MSDVASPLLEAGPEFSRERPQSRGLRVAVSGASGLVGSALTVLLRAEGHQVLPMVRREPSSSADEISWDPAAGRIESEKLDGLDCVVNLAGEGIASGRWTASRKAKITP